MSKGAGRRSRVFSASLAALIAGVGIAAQQPPRFGERVDVARIIVDARVLDDRGNPVPGLTADDCTVRIDGKTARVETATWVGERDASLDAAPPAQTSREGAGAPIGQTRCCG